MENKYQYIVPNDKDGKAFIKGLRNYALDVLVKALDILKR